MGASFRPPSASAIWKTDLQWGSRKDLHVLTKHKLAVVSISFLGNEQIPELVRMCNQEFKLKLPCVQDRGVFTDLVLLLTKSLIYSCYWPLCLSLLWSAFEFYHFCYTFGLFILEQTFFMGHSVVESSQLLCYKQAVRLFVFIKQHLWYLIHRCVQDLCNSRFLAGMCTLNLSPHLDEGENAELLSETPKAYVTLNLICSDSSFHR